MQYEARGCPRGRVCRDLISRKIRIGPTPCLPCTCRVSGCGRVLTLSTFVRKGVRIRSMDSVLITRVTSPRGKSCIVSVYTTPNKGDLRVTSGVKSCKAMSTHSVDRCGISVVRRGVREASYVGIRTRIVSTAMFSMSSRLGTSIILTSIPYSKCKMVKGGPRVGCEIATRGRRRVMVLREAVLSGTTRCIGPNKILMFDAYAVTGRRGRRGVL